MTKVTRISFRDIHDKDDKDDKDEQAHRLAGSKSTLKLTAETRLPELLGLGLLVSGADWEDWRTTGAGRVVVVGAEPWGILPGQERQ